jgi:hypothetical protein
MIAGGVWQLLVVEDVVARQPVALIIEFHLAVGQIWNRVKCISQTAPVERLGVGS